MKRIQSTCNYCALDCNLDFYVENERIVKVLPTRGYPVNEGFACIKGVSLDRQQTRSKPRGLPKIRRKDGQFSEVSWEEGFRYVAEKIKEIQGKYGKEAFAGISTGQLTLEEFALYGHVMRDYLQTNVDGNTRLCMATAAVAHKQSYGFDAPGYTLEDIELSDTIIFIGANPVVAHPILWEKVLKNRGPEKRVIVIDPRKSETAINADYWYGLSWKSDLYLLYAIAAQLIEKDYLDKEFIKNHTEQFEEYKVFLKKYTLELAAEKTRLSKEQILELAELIHNGRSVSFWWTMGVNQSYQGVRTAQAIINLALMTGNIGKPGTGANSITGQCNAMSSRVYSNTTGFYGGGDFSDPKRRERIAQVLGVKPENLAKKPTLPYNEIIEAIHEGKIKGLWILCTNPRHSWTNNETFAKATKKLEFFLVQDIYDTIESMEDCTVYFPVVSGIKKEGTYINLERRLSAMRPVLQRQENELCDYEVILGVGRALGMGEDLEKWSTPRACFNLMKECSRGMPSDITGVTWEALENSMGIQWPYPEGKEEENKGVERRLYGDGIFFTDTGKARFIFEEVMDNPLPTTEEYPWILNTGRGTVGQWHTQSRTREVKYVEDVSIKKAYLYMNDRLAREKGIRDMDRIRVYSINGENAVFYVKLTKNVQYEELFCPLHYIECNKLTPSLYDPYSKEPSYKTTPIRFEKYEEQEENRDVSY